MSINVCKYIKELKMLSVGKDNRKSPVHMSVAILLYLANVGTGWF